MSTTTSKAAAALGRVKSPAKTKAARQNGQLGGRPRKDEVLARWYETDYAGQQTRELVRTVRGAYLVAINGRINDARSTLPVEKARELWDDAAYQTGERP